MIDDSLISSDQIWKEKYNINSQKEFEFYFQKLIGKQDSVHFEYYNCKKLVYNGFFLNAQTLTIGYLPSNIQFLY